MRLLYFFLIMLLTRPLFAQELREIIYLVDNNHKLRNFDIESCTYSTIGTIPVEAGFDITDITFTPNGKLYGINRSNIIEIDTATAESAIICTFPYNTLVNSSSLTYLNDSVLLTFGNDSLWAVDLYACSKASMGKIPWLDGDLTWYNGELYGVGDKVLYRIALDSSYTEVVSTIRVNDTSVKIPGSYGLVTIGDGQDEASIVAFGESPYIMSLNPETGIMDTVCLPWPLIGIWGATSCLRYVDTVTDVDTGTTLLPNINISFDIGIYPNPIIDGKFYIKATKLSFQKIFIYDTYGRRKELSQQRTFDGILVAIPKDLPDGEYIVELLVDKGLIRKKVVIKADR